MVTMNDVARDAGVSRTTVSYALRDDPSIPEHTKTRILDAARRLGYRPNLSAQTLRSGRSDSIALILQDLRNPYSLLLSDRISCYAEERGLQTVIQQTTYRKVSEEHTLRQAVSSFCDGVILAPSQLSQKSIHAFSGGKPMVLLTPASQGDLYDTVAPACDVDAYNATSYLLSRGCQNIALLGAYYCPYEDIKNLPDSRWQRVAGFELALLRNGIEPAPEQFLNPQGWEYGYCHDLIKTVYRDNILFDGLVCMNDTAAIGAISALNELGINIPGEVSVIGHDGIKEGEFVTPALSTVAMDFDDLAHKVVDALVERIAGGTEPVKSYLVNTRLEVRESTR